MYDVTAANGSRSSGSSGTGTFFQKTWTAVNIPALVSGNTAYVAITGSTMPSGDNAALLLNSWSCTVKQRPVAAQPFYLQH